MTREFFLESLACGSLIPFCAMVISEVLEECKTLSSSKKFPRLVFKKEKR